MAAGPQSFKYKTFKSIDCRIIRQNCRLSLFLCSPPVPDGNLPAKSRCRHGISFSLIDLAQFSYMKNDPPAENFGVQCQRRRQHRRPKGRLFKEKSLLSEIYFKYCPLGFSSFQVIVDNFSYTGKAPDAFFYVGTSG